MNIEEIKKLVVDTVKETVEPTIKNTLQEVLKSTMKPEVPQNDIHNTIVENRNKERATEELIKKEKEDAVFVNTIYNELENNKIFLPEDTKKIVDACMDAGNTDSYRTELIKKEVTQRVFEIQDNMDKLSEHSKSKVREYLSLTDEAKLAKARDIWPLVNEVVNVKKNLYSQDEKRKQKNSLSLPSKGFTAKQEANIQNMKEVLFGNKKLDY